MSVSVCIVGYGGMGRFHRKHITKETGLCVRGLYDINPEKTAAAEKSDIKVFKSFEEVLSSPEIEAVLIATPNNFHMELSIRALESGKHVICEKPVTLNSTELEETMAVAAKTGRLFSVHQNRRWDRDFLIVKRVMEDGLIGKPIYVESRVQGSAGVPGDWRCVKEAGGGMLLDWGVHLIDQLLQLVDSPVISIYAHLLSIK